MLKHPSGFAPFRRLIAIALAVCAGAGCAPPESDEATSGEPILVFAAASTTDALGRLAEAYERRTGNEVRCSFAASSTLARQIEAGAPADVYLSANPGWMDRLESRELIDSASRRNLLANSLVLIAPKGREFEVSMKKDADFASRFDGRLALGDPDHVPAGQYARQALESLGWWEAVRSRLIPAMDVRDALRIVALGEAGAGIVYSTDARSSDRITVLAEFPPESHDPVRYPVALTRGASTDAKDFLAFLSGDPARTIFESAGFRSGRTF